MPDNKDNRDGRERYEHPKLGEEEEKRLRGDDPRNVRRDPKPTPPEKGTPREKEVKAFIDRHLRQKGRVRQDGLWPYLLIRAVPGDHGVRPLTVPCWESVDIIVVPGIVVNYDGVSSTLTPQAGMPHTIFVHVWNLGRLPAIGVKLRVYWVNPSFSPEDPAHPPHLISSMYLDLPDRQSPNCHQLFRLPDPWIPVVENGGHECLFAKVDCFADGGGVGFSAATNRHVGQRNLNLVTTQANLMQIITSLERSLPLKADVQVLHGMRDLQTTLLVHQPALLGRLLTPAAMPNAAFALPDGSGHLGAMLRGESGTDRFVPASVVGPMFQQKRLDPRLFENAKVRELKNSRKPVQALFKSLGMGEMTAGGVAKRLEAKPREGHMIRIQAVQDGVLIGGYTIIVQAEEPKEQRPKERASKEQSPTEQKPVAKPKGRATESPAQPKLSPAAWNESAESKTKAKPKSKK